MSWNIWITAVWRKKGETKWKPIANGNDFDDAGKYSIVTSEPWCCEIDIMESFDRGLVNVDDLPSDFIKKWSLKKSENGYANDFTFVSLSDYRAICAKIIDEYELDESFIFKALGCPWTLDSEYNEPSDTDEKAKKKRMTYPINKELLVEYNAKRPGYVKALKAIALANCIENLTPAFEDDGEYIDDKEIVLVFVAG